MSFENPITGSSTTVPRGNSALGGGLPGFIPPSLITTDNYDEFAQTRFYLREAINTKYARQVTNYGTKAAANSPFRLATNAGDPLSRKNYSCGGTAIQVSRPRNHGLRNLYGSINSFCDGSGIEASTCNVKYVYDSSDYTRFKKSIAANKVYNLQSNGGDEYHTSQVAIRAIRRY